MTRILKYIFYDVLRSRFVLAYSLFLFLSTLALFQLDADSSKVMLSLMNIVLIVVPLISIVFTTVHFYNSYEFIELMLAQPVNRRTVFLGEFLAITMSLCLAFIASTGIPMILYRVGVEGLMLLYSGIFVTIVFVSLGFFASVITRDKAKAIGIALLFWFYFSLIYDGLLLWIIYSFSDYPLEKATLALVSLNPIDLARIMILLEMDVAALMGYTGAFYKEFFGSYQGLLFSSIFLAAWIVIPLTIALSIFKRKDL
ncbi:MAG: ABC transporter permease subunit [Cyclobacteriaceae bacterium]